jgi:hypothetical protein
MRADISGNTRPSASSVCSSLFTQLLPVYVTLTLFIFSPYIWRLWVLEKRGFDQDEFEHLHNVWCIFNGMVPYRDFFESHTPWFHYLFASFLGFYNVDTSVREAFAFIFFARRTMWLFTGAILLLTFWLGKLWRNALVGLIGTLFLINTEHFLTSTLEFRPDLLSTFFWLGCLIMVFRGIKAQQPEASWTRWQFAWSGVFLGAAIMANQKVLLALPWFTIAMSFYVLGSSGRENRLVRVPNIAYQVTGFSFPIILTVAYFYLQNGLGEFVYYNFFYTQVMRKLRETPLRGLYELIYQNPYLIFFGGTGLVLQLSSFFRRLPISLEDLVLFLNCVGLIAGLFLIPPNVQYYLLFLPLMALFASVTLVNCLDKLTTLRAQMPVSQWTILVAVGSLPVLVALVMICRPYVAGFWFGALLIAIFLIFVNAQRLALSIFLVCLSLPPQMRTYATLANSRNTAQLDGIRYVIENTKPTETVMDGFSGSGVFRPHAYFYYTLEYHTRSMLEATEWDDLLKGLQNGRISPTLIIFDKELRALPVAITAFLTDHYQPVGEGEIWRRRENT